MIVEPENIPKKFSDMGDTLTVHLKHVNICTGLFKKSKVLV